MDIFTKKLLGYLAPMVISFLGLAFSGYYMTTYEESFVYSAFGYCGIAISGCMLSLCIIGGRRKYKLFRQAKHALSEDIGYTLCKMSNRWQVYLEMSESVTREKWKQGCGYVSYTVPIQVKKTLWCLARPEKDVAKRHVLLIRNMLKE